MHTPLKDIWKNTLTILTVILGLFGFAVRYFLESVETQNKTDLTNFTLVLFILLLVLWILYREFHLSRKQKYANITHDLNSISRKLRDLNCRLSDDLENIIKRDTDSIPELHEYLYTTLESILNDVVSIFSLLTGTHCRAAIKLPRISDDEEYVITVARDRNSATENQQRDRTRNEKRSDLLEENTDFHFLFGNQDDKGHYINHNIPYSIKHAGYLNSSIDDQNNKLSYNSTIVWPIRRFMPIQNGTRTPIFYGFLAVDSESKYVFNEEWDKQLGAAITEQLYETFHLFRQLNNNIEENTTSIEA